jgi:hypothetical protein
VARSRPFQLALLAARRAPRPQLSSASSPSVIAHARNDRAAIRALPSSDTSSRRRTRRSRLCGNRGPTNVRANSAASSSVRIVTSRARRRSGSNTKFVMHRKLASHNRSSGGAVWRESFAPWLNESYGVLNPGGTSHSFSCPPHYGQRSCEPHEKAEYMAAPTSLQREEKPWTCCDVGLESGMRTKADVHRPL